LQAILQTVQAAVDTAGDAVELVAVGQFIEAILLPEPRG
jgi:hypothetical protein